MTRGRKGVGQVQKEHIFYYDVHDGITSLVLRSFTYIFFCNSFVFLSLVYIHATLNWSGLFTMNWTGLDDRRLCLYRVLCIGNAALRYGVELNVTYHDCFGFLFLVPSS